MPARTARPTRRVNGVTHCPGCGRPLSTDQRLRSIRGHVGGYGRTSSGAVYKRDVETTITWHDACLTEAEQDAEQERQEMRLITLRTTYDIAVAGGITDAWERISRDNGYTDEQITAVRDGAQP